MRTISHILGYPRIGVNRDLKTAVEAYWRGQLSQNELIATGQKIQETNWRTQAEAGLEFITVGDFSYYDHVLDTSALLGVVPKRFELQNEKIGLDTIFCMARGQAPQVKEAAACEMTKWFNTNYHYIVPEFTEKQCFRLATDTFFKTIDRAQALGYRVKPVLLGPLSFLWLGKAKENEFNKLELLKKLVPVYNEILQQLKQRNIEWLQLDEPILTLDLTSDWQEAFIATYQQLNFDKLNCLLATYFGSLGDNLKLVNQLPISGIHIDLCSAPEQLSQVLAQLPHDKILSLGIINGRNIWRADLKKIIELLKDVKKQIGERLWIGTSCSLLHVPVDLDQEDKLDPELKSWLAFAKQKVSEVTILAQALTIGEQAVSHQFAENKSALLSRTNSTKIHNPLVTQRCKMLPKNFASRNNPYSIRATKQRAVLELPLLPTTTIGSFPQTGEIRTIRHDFRTGKLSAEAYVKKIKAQIVAVIQKQEQLDIDVLVHGEAERNDMVEYFGEALDGFAFTSHGWVQSYGSRCVKPPIIYGDVSRPKPITVEWSQYAQSLTPRPVKGMLTGPVTILSWSFVRDDQPHSATALQIALALREEAQDLEKAGIKVIQIDEPAFREALPLRKNDWGQYLDWAVFVFRVAACGVQDQTQIHTHMCYSEFNDVIEAIAALDADVITIESSRSEMELLKAFEHFAYPNEIGPGVYDIHSPRIPSIAEIVEQLEKALQHIPIERLWVNPDCGLKTRSWPEVEAALANMVAAVKILRTSN